MSFPTLWSYGLWPAGFLLLDFPGKNTAMGCHFLHQGIFLTQGLMLCPLCFLPCQGASLPWSHLGSLKYAIVGDKKCEGIEILFSFQANRRPLNQRWGCMFVYFLLLTKQIAWNLCLLWFPMSPRSHCSNWEVTSCI